MQMIRSGEGPGSEESRSEGRTLPIQRVVHLESVFRPTGNIRSERHHPPAMFRLFRPQIVELLQDRDAVVADWQKEHPEGDVFEDRKLDLPSRVEISVEEQIRAIKTALEVRC